MRFCYLAYPIDNAKLSREQINDLEDAKSALLAHGVDVIYDPGDAFVVRDGAEPGDEIDWCNRRAAAKADGVFAYLPAGMASTGVPIEIDRALSAGKWVALVSDSQGWMLRDQRRGLARFGLSREDLGAAVEWLASRQGEVYPLQTAPVLGVRRLDEHVPLPHRRYLDDAGIDLVVSERTVVPPASWRDVPNGVAVELPERTFGMIVGRSSTRRTKGLFVHTGIIDEGWRGELFSMVENVTDQEVVIEAGERVAQLIVLSTNRTVIEERQVLTPHPRGENGFGSSGR